MRASHYQQWRVFLSYILFALRNLKDLKSQVPFLQDKAGTLEGGLTNFVGQERKEGDPPKVDTLYGLLGKSLEKVKKLFGTLLWTWCAIMNI